MTIGERIKKRRTELDLSQEEVANELGYKSRTSVFKVEQGITDLPLSKVKEFAKVLKTTPSYLMGWEDDEGNLDVDNLPKKEKLNYEEFMEQSKFFFNDENVSGEDKELFFKSLQEIFLDSLKRTKKWGIQWEKILNWEWKT